MYVTAGERYQMQRAQDLSDLGGKVVRLQDDGSVPPDNPFVGRAERAAGDLHLGPSQSAGPAPASRDRRMWEVEHGPRAATSSTS
jgi:glucose/arabinose dehydrogenase